MEIKNVKAVITGAGSGLGEGTSRYLKNKGAEVLLIDLNADGLKKVADDINWKYVVGDVSNEVGMKNDIDSSTGINCLINWAGIAVGEKVASRRGTHDL